jgi:hypothetical protein
MIEISHEIVYLSNTMNYIGIPLKMMSFQYASATWLNSELKYPLVN